LRSFSGIAECGFSIAGKRANESNMDPSMTDVVISRQRGDHFLGIVSVNGDGVFSAQHMTWPAFAAA